MISLEKWLILTPLQKLSKNVGDLGNWLLPKALKTCPKSKKSPNLVTLFTSLVKSNQVSECALDWAMDRIFIGFT